MEPLACEGGLALPALRQLWHLGGFRRRRAPRLRLQVPHRLAGRRQRTRQGRPVCLLQRDPAGNRLAGVGTRLCLGRWAVDAHAGSRQCPRCADVGLRAACRFPAGRARRGQSLHDIPRDGLAAGRIRGADGIHARRAHAHHGASVLRLVGLPDHRLLRAHRALRHAAGPDVLHRRAASARYRRVARLGALALSQRCPRAGAL